MLHIAICDDENVIVNQIEDMLLKLCRTRGIQAEIEVFYGGTTLEGAISMGKRYDIIYLDIQMENGNGITAAKNIRKIDENALFIYVSSYAKYMGELFELDVFGFILKPIQEKKLSDIFLKAHQKVCNKMFYFSFNYKNDNYKVPCKDILYFESRGRQISIFLQSGEVEVFNGKISEVEKKLSAGKIPFIRIHQSYLVNFYLIKAKSKTEVILVNQMRLPVSKDRQKDFNSQYKILMGEEIHDR